MSAMSDLDLVIKEFLGVLDEDDVVMIPYIEYDSYEIAEIILLGY